MDRVSKREGINNGFFSKLVEQNEEMWDAARLFRRNHVYADCVNLNACSVLTY